MSATRILLISAAFCVAVVSLLLFTRTNHSDAKGLVDDAMVALQTADRDELVQIAAELKRLPGANSEWMLVDSGIKLVDGEVATALQQLESVSVKRDLTDHQKLLTSVAFLRLGREEESQQILMQVLSSDPDNEFAKLGMQMLRDRSQPQTRDQQFAARMKPAVERFCGDCHATPLPESFPKHRWEKEVAQGYGFYGLFDRHDLDPPDQGLVQKYYETLAPMTLASIPSQTAIEQPFENGFARVEPASDRVEPASESTPFESPNPAIAHVEWGSLQPAGSAVVVASDMRSGEVLAIDPREPGQSPTVLAKLEHPCRTTKCDLNQDGINDLLVADLGSFFPEDHRKGRVVWLKGAKKNDAGLGTESAIEEAAIEYEPIVLLDGLGRVSDVEPGDFDGDGDLDLVVAEFGWRTSGRVLYLENRSDDVSAPRFEMQVVDRRHGTIHVPVIDLDDDGNLDFIALISQEHEVIVAFLGDGKGKFDARTIYSANDPSYGSSGIRLIDLDQDGDTDILYTNGDTFDTDLMKPYHGVQWLENVGGLRFEYHHLVHCYGAYRADAADIDRDGDLDIVVAMALPVRVIKPERLRQIESMLLLRNDGKQQFTKEVIEQGNCYHTTFDFVDLEDDGTPEIVAGRLNVYKEENRMPMIDVYRNTPAPTPVASSVDLTR